MYVKETKKDVLRTAISKTFLDETLSKRLLCGRNQCMELIATCKRIDPDKPYNYYGCIYTGYIDNTHIQHIRQLYNSL